MNYTQIKERSVRLLLVDEKQAGAMCGKVTVFHEICAKYKVRPVIQKKSVKLWSVSQIEDAVAKLELEQMRPHR